MKNGNCTRQGGEVVQRLGYEPVWKDWDAALTT
jgi:hypothetical protein